MVIATEARQQAHQAIERLSLATPIGAEILEHAIALIACLQLITVVASLRAKAAAVIHGQQHRDSDMSLRMPAGQHGVNTQK